MDAVMILIIHTRWSLVLGLLVLDYGKDRKIITPMIENIVNFPAFTTITTLGDDPKINQLQSCTSTKKDKSLDGSSSLFAGIMIINIIYYSINIIIK